jgi:DNA-binding MarR family transcriptional regulator
MSDRSAELAAEIVGPLARRNSTATVLFHHAVAERLGLGPSDHKCLDLVRERGPLTAAELAALTGLSTGAITGVVGRLERAGFLRREPDPHDGRKQILSMTAEADDRLGSVFAGSPSGPTTCSTGSTRTSWRPSRSSCAGPPTSPTGAPHCCGRRPWSTARVDRTPPAAPRRHPPGRTRHDRRRPDHRPVRAPVRGLDRRRRPGLRPVLHRGLRLRLVRRLPRPRPRRRGVLHAKLFAGVLYGSALVGEIESIRHLDPDVALVHSTGSVLVAWRSTPPRGRLTRNTITAVRTPDGWRIAAIHNGRIRPVGVPEPDSVPARMARGLVRTAGALVSVGDPLTGPLDGSRRSALGLRPSLPGADPCSLLCCC